MSCQFYQHPLKETIMIKYRTTQEKIIPSEFQVLYPDQKLIDHTEFTPGSVIEIDGYTLCTGVDHKGEKRDYLRNQTVLSRMPSFGDVRPPLRCKVRKVHTIVSDVYSGLPYFIVETDVPYNEKERKLLRRDYHSFGLGHINRIIHKEPASVVYQINLSTLCEFSNMLITKLQSMDNHLCFELNAIVKKGVSDGVFRPYKTKEWPYTAIDYSKKRLASWLKQNINRFKQKKYLINI